MIFKSSNVLCLNNKGQDLQCSNLDKSDSTIVPLRTRLEGRLS